MNGTILIVDDDEDSAEALRDVLRMRGYDALAVTSGQACLEYLATHPADVVVTDLGMPGMSGFTLCAALRDRYPELLPIVVTGENDIDATRAIDAGAYALVRKPLTVDAVEAAVARALEHARRRAMSS
jgi:DNA-binding NtrC family response regulator